MIIAGSRSIKDKSKLVSIIANDNFCQWMDELVHGGAQGVDTVAEEIIQEHWDDTEITVFEPDWDKHGKAAGPIRNQEMAEYADKLLAIWDGESRGTRDMIEKALDAGLDVHVEVLTEDLADKTGAGEDAVQGSSDTRSPGEPPKLLMLKCPECSGRTTIEPDNILYTTGGYECPECSVLFKPVAKYEKVGEAHD